jgi:hypothetical protein
MMELIGWMIGGAVVLFLLLDEGLILLQNKQIGRLKLKIEVARMEKAQPNTRTRVFCSGCNQEITEVNYFSNEAGAWCDTCFETENPRVVTDEDAERRGETMSDQSQTMLEEFISEHIDGRVCEGMYWSVGGNACYDPETVNIELVEHHYYDVYPKTITGESEADSCIIHCEDCYQGKCPPTTTISIGWTARFKGRDNLTLTYLVKEK